MAIRMNQMKVYDKDQGIAKSHKEAVAMSEKNVQGSKKESKEESVMKRVRRKLYEVYHGGNAYMPKKSTESTRTKVVSGGLKQAGLTDKEIAKLKGKK